MATMSQRAPSAGSRPARLADACHRRAERCLRPGMDDARIARLRQAYADELARITPITYPPVAAAFAAVPRERFVGPGPWSIFGPGLEPSQTPDGDPAHIYRNVLVSLDAAKRLNNGEPRFWALLFERLKPAAGERAIHVGAGTGYYSALIAEMVAP